MPLKDPLGWGSGCLTDTLRGFLTPDERSFSSETLLREKKKTNQPHEQNTVDLFGFLTPAEHTLMARLCCPGTASVKLLWG